MLCRMCCITFEHLLNTCIFNMIHSICYITHDITSICHCITDYETYLAHDMFYNISFLLDSFAEIKDISDKLPSYALHTPASSILSLGRP